MPLAKYERLAKDCRNNLRQMLQHIKNGRRMGGVAPFGYKLNAERDVVPDEAEQQILERMRTLAAEGMKVWKIAETLNYAGVKTRRGRAWRTFPISRILARPATHLAHSAVSPADA